MEQSRLELLPIWNAGVAGITLICYTTGTRRSMVFVVVSVVVPWLDFRIRTIQASWKDVGIVLSILVF